MKLFLKIFLGCIFISMIGMGFYLWKPAVYTYNQTPAVNSNSLLPKSDNSEATFLAVGDIMLSRSVAKQMAANGNDGLYPYEKIKDLLLSTDFNFGNLESPYSGSDAQDPDPYTYTFNSPTWSVRGLSQYNFDILNLANNHALNQGKDGLVYTKKYLLDNGLQSVGTGLTPDDAWQSRIVSIRGIKIGFIGATYGPTSKYLAQITDAERLQKEILNLKTESDFIVVTMHAGTEYSRTPNTQQTSFAHAAVNAGADMVIGAHPHWIQPVEQYQGKYIFYSLGNFIFDQSWSRETSEGLTLKISLTKDRDQTMLKQIELIPIVIERSGQPRIANADEKESILQKIKQSVSKLE